MSDLVLAALIAAAPSSLAAVLGFVNNTLMRRVERNTDGVVKALMKSAKKDGLVEGLRRGQEEAGPEQSGLRER